GDIVVEVHRPEQRPVLEQHPEQLADLVELLARALQDIVGRHHVGTNLRAQQTDQRLEEHRLTGTRRTEQRTDLTGPQRQRHVLPDTLRAEGLAQPLDGNLDSHTYLLMDPTRCRVMIRSVDPRCGYRVIGPRRRRRYV